MDIEMFKKYYNRLYKQHIQLQNVIHLYKQAYKIGKNIISNDSLYNNFNGKVLFNSKYSLYNIANL
jgi:hypothetical protein